LPLPFTQDIAFSSIVTALFLLPIYKTLREGGVAKDTDDDDRAQAFKDAHASLQKTMWMTFLGSSLTVVSSTALYINILLWAVVGGYGTPLWANPLLNAFVFGLNMDSVLNDLGMLLVCGVLKTASVPSIASRMSVRSSQHLNSVNPGQQQSIAPSEYAPSD
jgi:hypothetical protein